MTDQRKPLTMSEEQELIYRRAFNSGIPAQPHEIGSAPGCARMLFAEVDALRAKLAEVDRDVRIVREAGQDLERERDAALSENKRLREALQVALAPQACDGSGYNEMMHFDEAGNETGAESMPCSGCCACFQQRDWATLFALSAPPAPEPKDSQALLEAGHQRLAAPAAPNTETTE